MQPRLELTEIVIAEVKPVELALPVGRIEVEKRGWPVVPRQYLLVGKRLDLHASKALVCRPDDLGESFGIVVGPLNHAVVVVLLQDQAPEGVFLEIEETAGPLNVCQGRWILGCE